MSRTASNTALAMGPLADDFKAQGLPRTGRAWPAGILSNCALLTLALQRGALRRLAWQRNQTWGST